MPLIVTLVGSRHTDGTEGSVSLNPRIPWYVSSGGQIVAPGPLYFKITSSGTLTTLVGGPATVVPTYDSTDNMTFSPEGPAYVARINISGQEVLETWTVDGANSTIDWAVLGVKATPTDRVTYPVPLTTGSPVPHYANQAALPSGTYPGALVYLVSEQEWWGWNPSNQWHKIA